MIGTSLAFADGQFKIVPALLCMLFACGMQIAANFINDLFDFQKGTDRTDRLGPERACAQGWITPGAMKVGIGVIVILSCISGLGLLYTSWEELPHGGWELIVLGVFCVIFAFFYTTVLSYQGWGDLLVLIFFGFVPVGGTYYVQAYTFTPNVIIASLISGLVIDTLLVVNNYRDRDQDALSGKRTLIVRFGEPFGRYLYLWLGIIATLLSFWFAQGWNYAGIFMPFTYNEDLITFVKDRLGHDQRYAIDPAKITAALGWYPETKFDSILGETSRNMLFMGILLSVIIAITNR